MTILYPIRLLALAALLLALAACGTDDPPATDTHAEHDHGSLIATSADSEAGEVLSPGGQDGATQLWTCGMHPQIISEEPGQCPICGMDLTPVKQSGSGEGVVAIDPVTIQNIGVKTTTVPIESLTRSVRTTGRFEVNERAVVAVSPKINGWVEQLHVDYEGARVRAGEPLLAIYSPELVSTQEEYLLARRHAERLATTAGAEDARRLVEAARRRLAYWDITDAQIEQLEQTGTPAKTLTLYAPASGTVTGKQVVEGQQIRAGQTVLELANLSQLWLMIDVYEQDLAWVRVGTPATVTLPYQPGSVITGRIDYIYDTLDPATRTVQARVAVPNPDRALKPGMYATATLTGGDTVPLPTVPEEALIRTGNRAVVIQALGEGRFQPLDVTPGLHADGRVQILDGLVGGERVVTSAQFLIDSEARLKSAIGSMGAGHNHGDMARDELQMPNAEATDAKAMLVNVYAADANGDGFVYQCEQTPHLLADQPSALANCPGPTLNVSIGHAQALLYDAGYTNVPIDPARADIDGDGKVWQSPMHWAVLHDADGRCDICGMYLQEFTVDQARQNLREAGYQVTNVE